MTKIKVTTKEDRKTEVSDTVTRKLIPGTFHQHLVKAVLGLAGLVALWWAIATLREQAMVLLSGGSQSIGGGLLGSSVKKAATPAYFGPFLACSLALVLMGVVAVWSSTDVVGNLRKALGRRLARLVNLVEKTTKAHADAAARVVHIKARKVVAMQLADIDAAMTQLWTIRANAVEAINDPALAGGWWGPEGQIPEMPEAPFEGITVGGRSLEALAEGSAAASSDPELDLAKDTP